MLEKNRTSPPGLGHCGKLCSECPKRFGAGEKKKDLHASRQQPERATR